MDWLSQLFELIPVKLPGYRKLADQENLEDRTQIRDVWTCPPD
jgi:hypothetical protein